MRLDTVAKMEEFITNALISSPHVPLGVNVLRLAATHDEEGIARMARSIVVRYSGSDMQVQQKNPLVITRTMTFEISIASQSYLTESGHDYAVQMCSACHMTLTNQVPTNTGAEIMVPLHLSSEKFDGLTDSSHYVYSQQWQIEVQEFSGFIALDPCVARGNCSFLFPDNNLNNLEPGDIIVGNEIWVPVLPPPPLPNGEDGEYDPEYCGVVVRQDRLVYKHDTEQVFLYDYKKYTLVPTHTYTLPTETQTYRFLIVNIYDENGDLYGTCLASNCGNRHLIQIGGNQPNPDSQWLGGLWNSKIDSTGNLDRSGGPEPFNSQLQQKSAYGYVSALKATVFVDPSDDSAATAQLKYGFTLSTWANQNLSVNNVNYIRVGGTPLGKAWIRETDIHLLNPDRYEQQIECDFDTNIGGETPEC